MDLQEIRSVLSKRLEFFQEYSIDERDRTELDRSRMLEDIEIHGVTGQQRLTERLFICRQGNLQELTPKRHLIRKKTYGDVESHEEHGDPIGSLLDDTEEWIAIARAAFVTQPKGPHGSERKVEIYK